MKDKNRFNKPVAFNTKNEKDNLILKHVKRRNFSGYVKKLILADIKSREEETPQIEAVEPLKTEKETAADKITRMREQMKKPSNQAPGPLIIKSNKQH
jgi:hypothetical protein